MIVLSTILVLHFGCQSEQPTSPELMQTGELIDSLLRINWNQNAGNPVFEPGTSGWDRGMSFSPAVVMFNDTLRMWYQGGPVQGFEKGVYIGYACSVDGFG
jgi:hypothetical protein